MKDKEEFSELKAKFVQWLITPSSARVPPTMSDFANTHGIHLNTLSRWKKSREVQREVYRKHLDVVGDDVQGILRALVDQAKTGSYQHIRLALEVLGYLDPKLAERIRAEEELEDIKSQATGDVLNLDDDALIRELKELERTHGARISLNAEGDS